MKTGRCGLCDAPNVPLVRSHIYPRWCAGVVQGDAKMMFTVSPHAHTRPSPLHGGGEYDRIVCDRCEQSFKAADDYFLRFYGARETGEVVSGGNGAWGVKYHNVDQPLLQRFYLTCLFRAHLSSRASYQTVDLGPYAARMKEVLRRPPAIVPEFPVSLVRESHVLGRAFHLPHIQKLDGVKFWRLMLPHFAGLVRVGKPSREVIPTVELALGRNPEVWMPDLREVPPGLLASLRRAKATHGDDIDRLVAKSTR
jgi:hypothetical protein